MPSAEGLRPGAVVASEGKNTVLARGAAEAFEAHILRSRAARHQHVAHHAVLADAERRAIDEVAKAAGVIDAELDQVAGYRIRRQRHAFICGGSRSRLAL